LISINLIDNSGSITDLITIAFFPLVVLFLLKAREKEILANRIKLLILTGALVGLSLSVKYTLLVLIPMGVIWIFLARTKNIKHTIIETVCFFTIPALTYVLIAFINESHSENIAFLDSDPYTLVFFKDISWILNSLYQLLSNFLIRPLHIHNILELTLSKLNISEIYNTVEVITTLVIFAGVIFLITKYYIKFSSFKNTLIFLLSGLLALISFYLFLAGYMYTKGLTDNMYANWPFVRFRYSLFFALFTILVIIHVGENYFANLLESNKRLVFLISFISILVSFIGIIKYSNVRAKEYKQYETNKKSLLKKLDKIKNEQKNILAIALSPSKAYKMLIWEDKIYTSRNHDILNNSKYYFSEKTLFLYITSKNKKDISFVPKNIIQYWDKEETNNMEIYFKVYKKDSKLSE